MRAPVFAGLHDPRRLIPKLLRKLLVPVLHLLMRDIQLGFPRLMRGDLGSRGALSIRFSEVVFNLLTTRAGCVEVFARVTADLRLAAATPLDLVTQRGQSCR